MQNRALVGCAGWSISGAERKHFTDRGTSLERYASRLPATEINSSFYRPHRSSTYLRWAASVPPNFRFSVKIPKTITHGLRLVDAGELLELFLSAANALDDKLGCLLVQLPPSLQFDSGIAEHFFQDFRSRTTVPIACEPRHPSWFDDTADNLLASLHVSRVAADPARTAPAALPGGSRAIAYYRLHGSPRTYYSAYTDEYIASLSSRIETDVKAGRTVWCIFDNTVLGAATVNARELLASLSARLPSC